MTFTIQGSRGRGRPFLIPLFHPLQEHFLISRQFLQRAHHCTWLVDGLEPGSFGNRFLSYAPIRFALFLPREFFGISGNSERKISYRPSFFWSILFLFLFCRANLWWLLLLLDKNSRYFERCIKQTTPRQFSILI